MKTLLDHRSIRKYKDRVISDQLLHEIIEAGCRASTTGNMQVYSIINTTDKVIKEKLAPTHFNQPMITTAPNVLTFCADFNRFNKWCTQNNAEPGYTNFLSFMTAAIDALLVAQNVCIAAEDKGLGICYLGTTIYNADKIIDILNLPKGVVPITTVTIGWPNETPALTDRLPLEAILHSQTYSDYNEQAIDKIYAKKEALEENKQFVVENNKESLAQVFTDVRYKKQDNEFFSQKLFEVLKQQGFIS
ncbi:MAG: nitroreductase family protein [Prolixibacteraceae bacterium]|jgi:nitroreductase|nr:nitroreductase family protein [Prolixibacteraceae bacterium]